MKLATSYIVLLFCVKVLTATKHVETLWLNDTDFNFDDYDDTTLTDFEVVEGALAELSDFEVVENRLASKYNIHLSPENRLQLNIHYDAFILVVNAVCGMQNSDNTLSNQKDMKDLCLKLSVIEYEVSLYNDSKFRLDMLALQWMTWMGKAYTILKKANQDNNTNEEVVYDPMSVSIAKQATQKVKSMAKKGTPVKGSLVKEWLSLQNTIAKNEGAEWKDTVSRKQVLLSGITIGKIILES